MARMPEGETKWGYSLYVSGIAPHNFLRQPLDKNFLDKGKAVLFFTALTIQSESRLVRLI